MDELTRLKGTAEKCRRLALVINDAETVARLTDLAEDCERRLQRLQASGEGQPHPSRKP
jgi:hypothetical protein